MPPKSKYVQFQPTGPRIYVNQQPTGSGPVVKLTPKVEAALAGIPPHRWQLHLDGSISVIEQNQPVPKPSRLLAILLMWPRIRPHLITAVASALVTLALKSLL